MAANGTFGTRLTGALLGLRPLFYLEPPSQSAFQETSQVPDYLTQAVPYFLVFIALESAVRWLQGLPPTRINDALSSLTAGTMMNLGRLVIGAFELLFYSWVYEHCRLVTLPWDSPLTWWLALVAVDFFYYWFHRMAHEVNLFWAAHQVHHSSEEYNLSTALRQSALQRFTSWFFYFPMAVFGVPPAAYVVHKQFNLLYQFWIHTEVIDRLGPLELVLNTPSHHRVHHGRNRYCIDKNYAGVFIVWDRMFGTFEPEGAKVVYGLVHPLASWNPVWAQMHSVVYMARHLWSMEGGLSARLSFLLKGPGWSPGKPRTGCPEDIPVVPEDKPYDPAVPAWLSAYCVVHFALVTYAIQLLMKHKLLLPYVAVLLLTALMLCSLTAFGLLLERRPASPALEAGRLTTLLLLDVYLTTGYTGPYLTALRVMRVVGVVSLCLWAVVSLKQLLNKRRKSKVH